MQERALREEVLGKGIRQDGRKFDEIRQITIENSVLPRVHGSTVFTRGETQALVTARSAPPTISRRSRWSTARLEALHAPLQLPAVLGR
jgi:polyribonucleotide nucleotidyltransferase